MKKSVQDRFYEKVNKDGEHVLGMALPCWEWTGAFDDRGHPRFWYKGTSEYAKRMLFLMEGATIVPEHHVVTFCQNRKCVRPEHHVLGSPKDARSFGRGGYYCPVFVYMVRESFAKGEITSEKFAWFFDNGEEIATALIQEGLGQEQPLDDN